MKVKDIMTREVIFVSPETKITEVARLIFENHIHAVPVVESGKVVGIVSEDDFFTRDESFVFLPSYIEFIRGAKIEENLGEDKQEKVKKLMDIEAKDIMSKDCVSILENMDVSALLEFFRETRFPTLPVVREDDKLVGIVTVFDMLGLTQVPDKL